MRNIPADPPGTEDRAYYARTQPILHWGEMGSRWGGNRIVDHPPAVGKETGLSRRPSHQVAKVVYTLNWFDAHRKKPN